MSRCILPVRVSVSRSYDTSVRLIQAAVPAGKRTAVLAVLDEEGIDYAVTDETGGGEYVALVTFPLPNSAVEGVLDELTAVGIDETAFTVILEAEWVVSRRYETLAAQYELEAEDERIAHAEIRFLFLIPPDVDVTGIEQISGRLSPDLLSLAIALGSGVAGARSLSSDISTALVGVLIAAALVPPTAVIEVDRST